MKEGLKSGREVIDQFFEDASADDTLDQSIVEKIMALHKENKLSDKNLSNALSDLREEVQNAENKKA
jgi:hypothetical protein